MEIAIKVAKESRKNKPAFLISFSNEKSLKKTYFFLDKLIWLCYNVFEVKGKENKSP